jgi:hypothetical protein
VSSPRVRARRRAVEYDSSRAPVFHDLDLTIVDELEEISGDEQLWLVWCDTHQKFEWHWIRSSGEVPERFRRWG